MIIPIFYSRYKVGEAEIDDDLSFLGEVSWTLLLTKKIHRLAKGAPEQRALTISLLKNDTELLRRCRPVHILNQQGTVYKAQMSKIVVSSDAQELFQESLAGGTTKTLDIKETLMKIPPVIHLDGNNLNCQRENLLRAEDV